MKNPLADTLAALNNDPKVNHASGVGEERTLILDMIDDLILAAQDGRVPLHGMPPLAVAKLIAACIRRGHHRKGFDD